MNNSITELGWSEIRLLRLKPASYQHPQQNLERFEDVNIFCDLEVASRRRRLSYTALSYAWGSSAAYRPICIGDSITNVSVTLEAALQELRDENEDLMLWVDQLCINQNDEEEKSQQVRDMKNIYAQATHVITWTGVAADESDLILAQLTSIGERAPTSTKALTKKSFQNLINRTFAEFLPVIANPQTLAAVSTAFGKFCQRPYWRRLWVIQEYSVARKVEIVCGGAKITHLNLRRALDSIARLLYYLEDLGPEDSNDERVKLGHVIVKAYSTPFSSFLEGIVTRRHKYQNSKVMNNSLFHVLISSLVLESDHNHPECSDPRDRIFAVLGLADDALSFDGFPDYSSTCEDVYTKVTQTLLEQGHIDIFSYCHFPRNNSVPSWVPDWRTMTLAPIAYDPWRENFAFMACGATRQDQNISFTYPNLISLHGTIIDTIVQRGNPWDTDWLGSLDPVATLRYLDEIESFCVQSSRINIGEEAMHTSRIAIAAMDQAGAPDFDTESMAIDSYRRLRESLQAAGTPVKEILVYDKNTWYRRAIQFLRPCRPFITSSGFVGLGPCDIETGDATCIFLGGLVPYVLRYESDEMYSLVGEAYIHGVMFGEHMRNNPVITPIVLK